MTMKGKTRENGKGARQSKAVSRPKSAASSSKIAGASKASGAKRPAGQAQSGAAGQESRIEAVRQLQLAEGNFDCFARAVDGYCDQDGCCYRSECLEYSAQAEGK